jgi:hypothetical protein
MESRTGWVVILLEFGHGHPPVRRPYHTRSPAITPGAHSFRPLSFYHCLSLSLSLSASVYLAGDDRVETGHVFECGLGHVDVAVAVAVCRATTPALSSDS